MPKADDVSELSSRVSELDQLLAALEGASPERGLLGALRELLPAEARAHLRAARKEQLLAARAVLDHWIEREERGGRPRRRESIKVE